MLSIIINWIYVSLTVFPLGFGFSHLVERFLGYRVKRLGSILMSGIVLATVYAEAFSLFYRVNVEANALLLIIDAIITLLLWRKILTFAQEGWKRAGLVEKIGAPLLFLAWSYFASRGYCVPDMNLYHGQSIRWIEEYGVVKGLVHVHSRFAYNSAVFALSALYDVHFLADHALHAINGFLAFVLSFEALALGKCFSRRKMLLSDYARVALVYYMSLVWDEVVAPSSDYAVMFTIFFLVINWLELLEDEERDNITPYCLLCVLGVYALSLKLTAGLILVLLLKPATRLLREKRWKEIVLYLSMGILVAFPWIARTVIISGWLFYPFSAIDLFDVEWKLRNVELIDMDAKLIAAWARGTRHLGVDIPIGTWYPLWFQNELFASERVIILGDLAACLWTILSGLWILLKKKWERGEEWLVLFTLMACFLFWQCSAPMLRYGYAYVLLLVFVAAGQALEGLMGGRKGITLIYAGLLLFICFKLAVGAKYFWGTRLQDHYVWQEDYARSDCTEYVVGNVTFYRMEEGYPPGYYDFPVYSAELGEIELLGNGIKDGFRGP